MAVPQMPYMMADTPEEFDRVTGRITIDKFSTTYRAWDQTRHVHFSSASHGSCAAQGTTLDEAVANLEKLVKKSRPGFHCTYSCPDYVNDLY